MRMMKNGGKIGAVCFAVIVVACAAWMCFGLRPQPQLPASDEVPKAVDSLFTAVTARDAARLSACQQRLETLYQAGQLPNAAWKRLQAVIAMSHQGDWEPAARRLYEFIQGQRGEGTASRGESRQTAIVGR